MSKRNVKSQMIILPYEKSNVSYLISATQTLKKLFFMSGSLDFDKIILSRWKERFTYELFKVI